MYACTYLPNNTLLIFGAELFPPNSQPKSLEVSTAVCVIKTFFYNLETSHSFVVKVHKNGIIITYRTGQNVMIYSRQGLGAHHP